MKKISEAFFCRPWAIKEEMLGIMSSIVDRHLRGEKLSSEEIEAKIGDNKKDNPGYQVINGNGVVPVYGVIAKRMNMFMKISGGTSTQETRSAIQSAIDDPNVKQILLDIDSPGGSVDGTFELADFIYSVRGKKPIIAYANGMMASAAYAIGSAADKIFATKTTSVGSIGVYMVVSDYTVANHIEGVKTEVIKAGKYKAAGHPDKSFTADDRQVFQEEIDTYYNLFVSAVARNRGISEEEAKQLADGRVYIGENALKLGLIDGIGEIDAVISTVDQTRMISRLSVEGGKDAHIDGEQTGVQTSALTQTQEEGIMDLKDLSLEQLRVSRPDLCEKLIAEGKTAGIAEGKTAGMAEGKTAGVSEERARVVAIVKKANTEFKGMGMDAIVEKAAEEGKSIEAAHNDMLGKRLNDVQTNGNKAPGPDSQAEGTKTHLQTAEEYQAQHKCSIAEALSATAPVRKTA